MVNQHIALCSNTIGDYAKTLKNVAFPSDVSLHLVNGGF